MPFKTLLIAATAACTTTPLDLAWARLHRDAAAKDRASFVADRDRIMELLEAKLLDWQVRPHETYSDRGSTVLTYDGPAAVRGERSQSAYFALIKPAADFAPPTFWELTPGFSPPGQRYWLLTASSCDLKTGDGIAGHLFHWTKRDTDGAPSYTEFKTTLTRSADTPRAFPTDTSVSHTVGAACVDIGNLSSVSVLQRR